MKNNINIDDTISNNSEDSLSDDLNVFTQEEILRDKLQFRKVKEQSKEEISALFDELQLNKEEPDEPMHEPNMKAFTEILNQEIENILIDVYENKLVNKNNPLTKKSQKFMKEIACISKEISIHFIVFILDILANKIKTWIDYIKSRTNPISLHAIVTTAELLKLCSKDISDIFYAAFQVVGNFNVEKLVMETFLKKFVNGDMELIDDPQSIDKCKLCDMLEDYSGNYMEEFYEFLKESENKENEYDESKIEEIVEGEEIEQNLNLELTASLNNSIEKEAEEPEKEKIDIDDLVKYINNDKKEEDNINTDKKKKRKKKKKNKKNKENNIDKDGEVEKFKQTIKEYSECSFITRKIEPKYSKEWLSYLDKLIRQNI